MKKSRKLFFHPKCNSSKLKALEELHSAYKIYLQQCIDSIISHKRTNFSLKDINSNIFPENNNLSTNIVQACQRHACSIVNSWVLSKYKTTIKKIISNKLKQKEISKDFAKQLYTVGKYALDSSSKNFDKYKKAIATYQSLLFDNEIVGNYPKISDNIEIRTTANTAVIDQINLDLTNWWLFVSCLNKGKRVKIPLKPNPYVKIQNDICKSFLIKKDKLGRWYVQVIEKQDYNLPEFSKEPKLIGIDIGLNVLAATSDGRLFGQKVKTKFNKLHNKIKSIRANRQRQNLTNNSKRLDNLEYKLSSFIKSEIGRITNKLTKQYGPDVVFVMEDLDLKGCRGQKRFAYNLLQNSLEIKVNTTKVPAMFSSQICSCCGYLNKSNRSGIDFNCKNCGKKGHADINASINLAERFGNKQIDGEISEVKKYFLKQYVDKRNLSMDRKESSSRRSSLASNPVLTFQFDENQSETALKAEGDYYD